MCKKRKEKEIITTLVLGEHILKTNIIPTPNYEKEKEYGFIVQSRGDIFQKKNPPRIKSTKF